MQDLERGDRSVLFYSDKLKEFDYSSHLNNKKIF
jgi:hypothetical protein